MKAACCAAIVGCLVLVAHGAGADEANAVSLFDRNSLIGWNDGGQPAKGWRMVDGVLQGDKNSTPLVSGWSWGDVALSFRWKVQGKALWRLRLLRVPDAETIAEIVFGEKTPSRGIVISSSKGHVKMILPASNDGWRTAKLTRHGGSLDLETAAHSRDKAPAVGDAGSISDVATGESRFCLELALLDGAGALADLKAVEPAGESIYNGKDLTGWWTPGNLKSWKPEPEAIICVNDNGNYLRTEREFANFTLALEYRMAKGGNSGIGIRTARDGWPSGDGMELQMLDEPPSAAITRHSTMAIYGNLEPLTRADRSQEWNRVVVKAEGYLISAWVNGVLVQHANTANLPELRRRNLKGWIGLQDHGARTEFRDLRVLEAADGLGLQAWYAPRPPSGSQLVLERLMNPERLAIDDGLGSGAVEASTAGKGEQVLAELKGPAAIVTVSRTSVQGRLAFYFDGEAAPRLECPAGKLHEHFPFVGQDTQPRLTYVPFHKSLKVTVSGGADADYRFEYVTFPENVPLEEFADGQSCVARGLLPALSYRDEQLGWGTHRETDPLPRAGKQNQKIDEQSQATLVDLEGPGIVEWTKLVAAPSLLDDDELWLEVTADEESAPAISTPARYFFPGLAGGNYHNYVVTNRNGWTNMLAMPFAKRLTIAVANHGRRPVHPLGLTVSYQPLDDTSDPRLARRLRGVFIDETDSSSERSWVKQSGGGRFIGLVTQYGKAAAGVDSLMLDGQTQNGWRSANWQTLLGMEPKATNERHSLSGRQGGFQWGFFLLAPPQFRQSFDLRATEGPPLGNRLALFYMEAE